MGFQPLNAYNMQWHTAELKVCSFSRPKLPQKLRTGKQWNEDSPASPAPTSVVSSTSANSLNDINELEELTSEDVNAPTLKIDRRSPARTPSPQPKVMNTRTLVLILYD
jgi:hypothetical protein